MSGNPADRKVTATRVNSTRDVNDLPSGLTQEQRGG
jgi:hypothetical protein